jgi:hypothetical protein
MKEYLVRFSDGSKQREEVVRATTEVEARRLIQEKYPEANRIFAKLNVK